MYKLCVISIHRFQIRALTPSRSLTHQPKVSVFDKRGVRHMAPLMNSEQTQPDELINKRSTSVLKLYIHICIINKILIFIF